MRRETYAIPGGEDAVRLFPQRSEERRFTPAESAIIDALLKQWTGDGVLANQFAAARISSRHLTGYGAYIYLTVPEELRADHAVVCNGCVTAHLWWRWREDSGLNAVVLAADGLLSAVELFPVDGENYTVDECERLLAAPIEDLTFHAPRY